MSNDNGRKSKRKREKCMVYDPSGREYYILDESSDSITREMVCNLVLTKNLEASPHHHCN